ncbi:1937_t:CDS:2 [Acaulospora colombiana]|uniref:1937_t:CDS:1 n=1 Tax=Acaulospora colombiana TaxID=27376 RepID=A0ACA9MD41_9GLOM|nr:1937_t:CDS:2 [Acaulospora colombiana]
MGGKIVEVMDKNCKKIEKFLKKYRSYSFYEGYNLKILKLLESTQIRMMEAHVGLRELCEYEYDLGVMQMMLQASQRELQEFENALV